MAWWMWLIIAVVLGIIEVSTTTFVLMWIGIGGLITSLISIAYPVLWFQVLVFAVVSAVLLVATRPLVRRWRQKGPAVQFGVEGMVGKQGTIVTPPADSQLGTARIHGELWSVVSDHVLSRGDRIVVMQSDSSVVKVEPISNSEATE